MKGSATASTSTSTIYNYLELLEACIGLKSLKHGKIIHGYLLKFDSGRHSSILGNLARLYIACRKPQLAHRVFDSIPSRERNNKTILWSQIIRAYAWEGPFEKAIDLYTAMVDSGANPTKFTYSFVLKACSALQDLETGLKIHERVKMLHLQNDVFVCTALVDFYVKCGRSLDARKVFDEMPEKDVVAWNAMVAGYSSNGMCLDAISLVSEMQWRGVDPNSSTIAAVLPAIGDASGLMEGKTIHGFCLRRGFEIGVVVGTALVDMYGKCGELMLARRVLDGLSLKTDVALTAMIGACVICNSIEEGLKLFKEMRVEIDEGASPIMVSTLLRACAKLNDPSIGRQLHGYIVKSSFLFNVMVGNTLLSMYSKCGLVKDAVSLFEELKVKDSVSYNALIAGFVQNGYAEKALQVFYKMKRVGVELELATMLGFFPACSYLAALEHGIRGHAYSVIRGFTADVSISNALINMYAKCGRMDAAKKVFDKMPHKDVVSWNAMTFGYGIHGLGNDAILLFDKMQRDGYEPDEVTFIALLSACSHSGLVSEGKHLFSEMKSKFKIVPRTEHYYCMVDLLGRAGQLSEAYEFISAMPITPDVQLWNALLSACKIHKNVGLGEQVSSRILSLGPTGTGNFVLLFNLFATAQRWDDAANVRIRQKEMGFKKTPGCSWIEVNGMVHAFVGSDRSHQHSRDIYKKLEELFAEIRKLGYTAESDYVYHDVGEEEKEQILLYHSEKLAVTYGVLRLKDRKAITVTKNLRVCGDCHSFLKYVTVVTKREISVRDTSRFHHFRHGLCSCGEFW
ncbi:pentatricopeptide repeat-containing protein At3g16610 [Andrographis paniculata]|uniref:pentatricopeptide repeat-containing protein At3g16610 n=1 Tax=Andrographis paniculata TaxID=175694 RepID=UPI0021E880F3|nr:pentatricopeptide repeat-containing protein At3g16610 [Andrographis paniculata]